ncbi:hypothetical protein APE_1211.1 [Aeropyrum pernix K1]|uniref:HTH arsR-type domain-containing protein n=1 Tax=Aeropyrum pernix (strain ATCC 700893 / DSM 11879 / JCM 9820 / NBRC 100138 / K1) TaxID=272557 RepID=Q9YCP7_AERPE|nr:hypothetical protein [Aeropyrum pernix]BAA80200.2 hypothetical protein APE_1211.1 [Aeropyrum pernix K1]
MVNGRSTDHRFDREKIVRRADEIAGKHGLLSHRLRILILAATAAYGEASWTSLKTILESLLGPVNPNTLAFHTRKLMEAGLLRRAGSLESPVYMLAEEPDREIAELAKEMEKLVKPTRQGSEEP